MTRRHGSPRPTTARGCKSSRRTACTATYAHLFTPETDIFSVADHTLVGKVQQASPFCPNIAATPRWNARASLYHGAGGHKTAGAQAPISVTLFDRGLVDVLEASVTGLQPMQPYVLALSDNADGNGQLRSLEDFMTNPAGAAIVNTDGPILEIVQGGADAPRRYLVIASGSSANPGNLVQIQVP